MRTFEEAATLWLIRRLRKNGSNLSLIQEDEFDFSEQPTVEFFFEDEEPGYSEYTPGSPACAGIRVRALAKRAYWERVSPRYIPYQFNVQFTDSFDGGRYDNSFEVGIPQLVREITDIAKEAS